MFTTIPGLTLEETQQFSHLIKFEEIPPSEEQDAFEQFASSLLYAVKINPQEILSDLRFAIATKLTITLYPFEACPTDYSYGVPRYIQASYHGCEIRENISAPSIHNIKFPYINLRGKTTRLSLSKITERSFLGLLVHETRHARKAYENAQKNIYTMTLYDLNGTIRSLTSSDSICGIANQSSCRSLFAKFNKTLTALISVLSKSLTSSGQESLEIIEKCNEQAKFYPPSYGLMPVLPDSLEYLLQKKIIVENPKGIYWLPSPFIFEKLGGYACVDILQIAKKIFLIVESFPSEPSYIIPYRSQTLPANSTVLATIALRTDTLLRKLLPYASYKLFSFFPEYEGKVTEIKCSIKNGKSECFGNVTFPLVSPCLRNVITLYCKIQNDVIIGYSVNPEKPSAEAVKEIDARFYELGLQEFVNKTQEKEFSDKLQTTASSNLPQYAGSFLFSFLQTAFTKICEDKYPLGTEAISVLGSVILLSSFAANPLIPASLIIARSIVWHSSLPNPAKNLLETAISSAQITTSFDSQQITKTALTFFSAVAGNVSGAKIGARLKFLFWGNTANETPRYQSNLKYGH